MIFLTKQSSWSDGTGKTGLGRVPLNWQSNTTDTVYVSVGSITADRQWTSDTGGTTPSSTTGPTENITTEITGDGVTGAVKYFQEGFFAKAGMHSWDFSSTVKASLGSSKDALGSGTDPFFGIGYGSEQLELGYEYYAIEDGDISALTLRYAHKF